MYALQKWHTSVKPQWFGEGGRGRRMKARSLLSRLPGVSIWIIRLNRFAHLSEEDSVKQKGYPEKEPAVFAVRWVQATDEKKARGHFRVFPKVDEQPSTRFPSSDWALGYLGSELLIVGLLWGFLYYTDRANMFAGLFLPTSVRQ